MKFEITPEEKVFREEVREWLRSATPKEGRPSEGVRHGQAMREYDLAWQRTQYDGGWAGISWPKEYGGRGASLVEQLIWFEEYARAHAPRVGSCFVGVNHGGPTLIARGSEEHKSFHLPKILKGEVVWCQGFSEPGSGSDLASLRTKAVLDGDHLVVNGSKIWTSYAQVADYQELLVRTDDTGKKQEGITWVICDMKTPGVEVRPILTMTGPKDSHFCQCFYTDVRIPLSNVVGGVGNGWDTANATLGFERGTAFIAEQIHFAEVIEELLAIARKRRSADGTRTALEEGDFQQRLAMSRAEFSAMRAMAYSTISRLAGGAQPGPEGSLVRLFFSEAAQRLRRLAVDILGSDGLELSEDEGWTRSYLRSFSMTISAGTADIQRNIIGERILGLPRGPKPK